MLHCHWLWVTKSKYLWASIPDEGRYLRPSLHTEHEIEPVRTNQRKIKSSGWITATVQDDTNNVLIGYFIWQNTINMNETRLPQNQTMHKQNHQMHIHRNRLKIKTSKDLSFCLSQFNQWVWSETTSFRPSERFKWTA